MSHRVTGVVAAIAALAAMALADPPDARADASEACYAHLASVKTANTTPAADRRYHLEHGQPSPCSESDAQDSTSNESKASHQDEGARRSTGQSGGSNDEGKSRWCRKHWYC